MRKKHTAPLLFLAALLVAAFAAPAANAAYWSSEASPLVKSSNISFQGSIASGNASAGYKCANVSGSMTLTPGDQGEITSISYSNCQGTGSVSGLSLAVTPIGLPWSVEAVVEYGKENGRYIYTDEVSENVKYNGQSLWGQLNSSWSLLPDNSEEISEVSIQGHNQTAMGAYQGGFDFTPAGFLGIEE